MDVDDVSFALAQKWATPIAIPNVLALRNYFHQRLEDYEKIPISQEKFDRMRTSSTLDPEHALSEKELSALFRVSTDERAPELYQSFSNAIRVKPPPDGTEELYHSTYDRNISDIIKSILPEGKAGRNSNRHTSTGLNRPDYYFLIRNRCILRGEEKGSQIEGNPAQELLNKLTKRWPYEPLSFILGLLSFYYRMTKSLSMSHSLLRTSHRNLLCCNSIQPIKT